MVGMDGGSRVETERRNEGAKGRAACMLFEAGFSNRARRRFIFLGLS